MPKNQRPRDRAALSRQKAAISLGWPEIVQAKRYWKTPKLKPSEDWIPSHSVGSTKMHVRPRGEGVCRAAWRGHPSSALSARAPEHLARHQDDCGLLSRLLQYHSCNLTVFFNPKELYKYMYIYSSVTECK